VIWEWYFLSMEGHSSPPSMARYGHCFRTCRSGDFVHDLKPGTGHVRWQLSVDWKPATVLLACQYNDRASVLQLYDLLLKRTNVGRAQLLPCRPIRPWFWSSLPCSADARWWSMSVCIMGLKFNMFLDTTLNVDYIFSNRLYSLIILY